ncbi:RNA polymerase sigma factor [Streptomyces sp. 8N706]|uniref:RNA polymerase sigma factor n=1 Tax=Streptomyces sp. 8N706 TaxID=3457416 RepID=UPI003FD647AC
MPSSPDPSAAVEEHQELQRIRGLLDRLPSTQRLVLALQLYGLSSREIAQELGIKEATVCSHIRHMRNRLAELLHIPSRGQQGWKA